MHYKDGTEAFIGDIVKGIPYNTKGEAIVGELVQVTPDSASCNCIVAFMRTKPSPVSILALDQATGNNRKMVDFIRRPEGGIVSPDAKQEELLLLTDYDYGQCDHFELVHRPG